MDYPKQLVAEAKVALESTRRGVPRLAKALEKYSKRNYSKEEEADVFRLIAYALGWLDGAKDIFPGEVRIRRE